jgi:hypothetical protein
VSVVMSAGPGTSVMLGGAVASVRESDAEAITWWLVTPEDVVQLIVPTVAIGTLHTAARVRVVGTLRAVRTRLGSRIVQVTCVDAIP